MHLGVYLDRAANIFYHFDPAYDLTVIAAAAVFFYLLRIVCVKFLFGVSYSRPLKCVTQFCTTL